METIFLLIIFPLLLTFTEPVGAALAGGMFLAVAILYRQRLPCRVSAFITSGIWFYVALRTYKFDGEVMSQMMQHTWPAFIALLFSAGTLMCIFAKDDAPEPTQQEKKQVNYAKYVRQSLRVGLEKEIIIENLIDRGLSHEAAILLVNDQIEKN
jgi:hypothetical protein